jgi:ubiquinone/menaquinone biosynthesis C-methylase UbiE
VIDLSNYNLTQAEHLAIESLLFQAGSDLSLTQLWMLMDQAWEAHGCDNQDPDDERLAGFYNDPVWLLNGMFIEQHALSMEHRQAIANTVSTLTPQKVVDFGGGFGTLARLLANALPLAKITICDPYPPLHGIESSKPYTNINFIPSLGGQFFDVLVCTDVLEHIQDPLPLLATMVGAVNPGGYLLIANCFHPVIYCHLPCTFHLRYSFDQFCRALGLEVLSPCEDSHASIYRRTKVLEPNWIQLRAMEQRSKSLFPWRQWQARHLNPWGRRAGLAFSHPLHYPRKLLRHAGTGL